MIEAIAIKTALGSVGGFLKSIPWQVYVIGGLVAAIPVNGCVQYDRGAKSERAAWNAEVERIRAEREALALVVANQDAEIAAASNQTIEERRKELDDAVADIPDQALTDRQRARVCAERVRQGGRCEFPAPTAPSVTD